MNLELQVQDNFLPKEFFLKLANYSVGLEIGRAHV